MFRGVVSVLCLLAWSVAASAGPWARDPGDVFLSYSLSADTTQDAISSGGFEGRYFHSVYGEVGLGRQLTLVFDIGQDDETAQGSGFVQYTFTRNATTWQVAAELGLGYRDVDAAERSDLYRVGLSFGRGFGRRDLDWVPYVEPRNGWFSVDSHALVDPDGEDTLWESEATFGLFLNDRFGGLLQIKAEEYPDTDLAVFVSPSMLVQLGERTTAQVGGRFGIEGSEEVGLRLGIWQDF